MMSVKGHAYLGVFLPSAALWGRDAEWFFHTWVWFGSLWIVPWWSDCKRQI